MGAVNFSEEKKMADQPIEATRTPANGSGKVYYLSFLAVLSCFSVVYLHANSCFWDFSTERYWLTADILESVFYFAVPIFFMLPGATLLDFFERYDLKTFFLKRTKKTVIPYLVWSMIAILIQLFIQKTLSFSELSVTGFIKKLLDGSASSVYWFFPYLFGVYLCIPLFASVSKERRKTVFSYLAILCFICNILIPFLLDLFGSSYVFPYTITVGGGYLFFVITGYLLHEYPLPKALRFPIYFLGLAGLAAHIIGTYFFSVSAGEIVSTFKGYTNLPSVLYAIAVFLFVKNVIQRIKNGKKESPLFRFVGFVKKYTLAIYLMHWFMIQFILKLFAFDTRSILYRLLIPLPVIALCILVTWLLRKIPGIRIIVPE